MFYVYIIKSQSDSTQQYIGYTTNIKQRLTDHNSGKSSHTSKYRPWIIETCIAFNDKYKAIEFEKYLKSHAGKAFAKKRLLSSN